MFLIMLISDDSSVISPSTYSISFCIPRYSILEKCGVEYRRVIPYTLYPFLSNNFAKYGPSCPIIPVIKADLLIKFQNKFVMLSVSQVRFLENAPEMISATHQSSQEHLSVNQKHDVQILLRRLLLAQ